MNAILRLYPRAWRERYGDELVALLEEQPATVLDVFDLIRGALDARLHPQVRGAAPDKEIPVNQRTLGAMAAIGGIAWIIGILTTLVLPFDPYGYPDATIAVWGVALGAGLIGVALGELGTRPGSISLAGHIIAIASIAIGATVVMGWPLTMIGLVGYPILVILAAARAYMNGRLPGWSIGLIIAATLLALIGWFGTDGGGGYLLFGLIGVVGLLVALVAFRSPPPVLPVRPTEEPA